MPTIYDIAKAAKVSIAAVSLVMNNPETPRVGAAKRKIILELAAKHGYSPSGLAPGLELRIHAHHWIGGSDARSHFPQ